MEWTWEKTSDPAENIKDRHHQTFTDPCQNHQTSILPTFFNLYQYYYHTVYFNFNQSHYKHSTILYYIILYYITLHIALIKMHSLCLSVLSPFAKPLPLFSASSTTLFYSFRLSVDQQNFMMPKKMSGMRSSGRMCYISSSSSALLSPRNLQWVAAVSSVILMLLKGTSINRSFLVPFFALQAPASVMSWMQGEYGAWSACLTLLVRLFFYIPGELELPFITLVLVLVAPRQARNLRGTREGVLISLVIGAYLAFLHFTRVGGLQKSFDQGSIVATLAVICTAIVPCLLLI